MAEKLHAAIFDWDGVVADSAHLQVEAEKRTAVTMADEYAIPFDVHRRDWDRFEGWGRTKIAKYIFDADDELAEIYRERVIDTSVEIIRPAILKPISGARGFIDFLKNRNLPLGIATSSSSKILHPSLKLFGMERDFQYAVCHREALDDKPLPGPYRKVMNYLNVEARRTLVIEDSKSGIEAGLAAGALVMAISTTKPVNYLRNNTRAHLVAEDYEHATYLVAPYL
ncbi:MAG: HAD family hydrolase [Candidatus Saccharimonadales bacterium]